MRRLLVLLLLGFVVNAQDGVKTEDEKTKCAVSSYDPWTSRGRAVDANFLSNKRLVAIYADVTLFKKDRGGVQTRQWFVQNRASDSAQLICSEGQDQLAGESLNVVAPVVIENAQKVSVWRFRTSIESGEISTNNVSLRSMKSSLNSLLKFAPQRSRFYELEDGHMGLSMTGPGQRVDIEFEVYPLQRKQ